MPTAAIILSSDGTERVRFDAGTTCTVGLPAPDAVSAVARAAASVRPIGEVVIVERRTWSKADYAVWDDIAAGLSEESFEAAAEAWPTE